MLAEWVGEALGLEAPGAKVLQSVLSRQMVHRPPARPQPSRRPWRACWWPNSWPGRSAGANTGAPSKASPHGTKNVTPWRSRRSSVPPTPDARQPPPAAVPARMAQRRRRRTPVATATASGSRRSGRNRGRSSRSPPRGSRTWLSGSSRSSSAAKIAAVVPPVCLDPGTASRDRGTRLRQSQCLGPDKHKRTQRGQRKDARWLGLGHWLLPTRVPMSHCLVRGPGLPATDGLAIEDALDMVLLTLSVMLAFVALPSAVWSRLGGLSVPGGKTASSRDVTKAPSAPPQRDAPTGGMLPASAPSTDRRRLRRPGLSPRSRWAHSYRRPPRDRPTGLKVLSCRRSPADGTIRRARLTETRRPQDLRPCRRVPAQADGERARAQLAGRSARATRSPCPESGGVMTVRRRAGRTDEGVSVDRS